MKKLPLASVLCLAAFAARAADPIMASSVVVRLLAPGNPDQVNAYAPIWWDATEVTPTGIGGFRWNSNDFPPPSMWTYLGTDGLPHPCTLALCVGSGGAGGGTGGNVNESQIGGVAVSLGSGSTDGGTQRFVMGSTEPTLTFNLPAGAAQDGTDASGVTAPSGGAGLRGWLSGIYAAMTGTLKVQVQAGGATQPVSAAALPLPPGAAQDGTDATSATQMAGGVGIRGWLSGIYTALVGTLTANVSKIGGVAVELGDALADASTPRVVAELGANGQGRNAATAIVQAPAPTSLPVGITPVSGTSSGLVVRSAAANLYGFSFTQGPTAGFLAILNVAAIPAASAAIAPLECIPVTASQYLARRADIPDRYTAGITFVSTSSCTTYTAVTPTVMSGFYQ